MVDVSQQKKLENKLKGIRIDVVDIIHLMTDFSQLCTFEEFPAVHWLRTSQLYYLFQHLGKAFQESWSTEHNPY